MQHSTITPAPARGAAQTLANFCRTALAWLCLLLFGLLAGLNLLFTVSFEPHGELRYSEIALFFRDDLLRTAAAAAVLVLLYCLARRWLQKLSARTLALVIVQVIFWCGVAWALLVDAAPRADQAKVLESAAQWLRGDYSSLYFGYMNLFPYQMGYAALLVPFVLLFGEGNFLAIQVFNAACIALTFWAVYKVSALLLGRETDGGKSVLLLSLGAWCAVMYSVWVYGNVPGNLLAVLALWFQLRWQKEGRSWWNLLFSGLCIGASILLKDFGLIFLAAQLILLTLHCIVHQKPQGLILLLAALLVWQGSMSLLLSWGAEKANHDMGKGVPLMANVVMGLSEEEGTTPGWYTGYNRDRFMELGFEREAAEEDARQELQKQIRRLTGDPAGAVRFFHQKTLSQWAEPTYQGLWFACSGQMAPPVQDFLYGSGQKPLVSLMNWYQSLVYAAAFGFLLARRRSLTLEQLLPGLIVLGGFLFQLFWEAKSQYVIQYFLLSIPYAAAGLNLFCGWLGAKLAQRGPRLPR